MILYDSNGYHITFYLFFWVALWAVGVGTCLVWPEWLYVWAFRAEADGQTRVE